MRLRQTHSVATYTHTFRTIALELLNLTEDEKLDKFVRNLKDQVHIQVELQNPEIMDQAAVLVECIDAILYQNTYSQQYTSRANHTTYNGPMPIEIDAIS